MSQLTTHILDTSKGKPAPGVSIILYQQKNNNWAELATGITNADGRIPDLVSKNTILETGVYKMKFETKAYFDNDGIASFYPYIEIIFDITTKEHYHIPLLLNPFGYSTYRGS
jgi:5-hydroxyisourate hydrolase